MNPAEPGSSGAADTSALHQFVAGASGPGPGSPASRRAGIDCAAATPHAKIPTSRREKNSRPPCQRFHGAGSSGSDYGADPACKTPDRRASAIARPRPCPSSDPPGSRTGRRKTVRSPGTSMRNPAAPCDAHHCPRRRSPLQFPHSHKPSFFCGCQKGHMPMRERPSPRTPLSFLLARDTALRAAAFLATLGLASAGIALGATNAPSATPFQVAYMYGTSGPAGGGTAINLVGNQFSPGATATIGGVGVGAIVTSSTRIGVDFTGARARRALRRDREQRRELRRPAQGLVRRFRRRGRGEPLPRARRDDHPRRHHLGLRRRQLLPELVRHARADGGVPPARRARIRLRAARGDGHDLRRRPPGRLRRGLDRAALRGRHHGRLPGRQPAQLLPGVLGHARPDGGLPPEDLPRQRLRAADGDRRLLRRPDRGCRSRPGSKSSPGSPSRAAAAARCTARTTR